VTAGSLTAGRREESPAARWLAAQWHRAALGGVLTLAALLDFVRLDRNGWANSYYSAAVRSMLRSWHNFLFASFDPGGLVSVDKPPLALWVEAASAKVFGYSGVAILLPEALAGVAAVWLLYALVARHFGRVAGLLGALALAVSPVSVAVSRDNNPDALFVFLLVAAAWAGGRAVESGRLRWLVGCSVLVGLAFETKMLAAGIVVPGLALAYLIFARARLLRRLWHLAVAGVVLTVVSGIWIVVVELTPAADRPYVGSTTDNSALSLALGYNGLGRVTGQTGGTSFGGGLGGAFSGTPGFFRLLNDALGDQGAWLLPLAIVGAVSAAVWAFRRRRAQLGPLVVLGGWFVCGAVVFSYSSGIIHTYYLSALAPATSALAGIGLVSLARDGRRAGPWAALPLLAGVFTAWLQVALLRRSDYLPWLVGIVVAAAIVAGVALVALAVFPEWRVRGVVAALALGVAAAGFLAAPAAWSESTQKVAVNGVFPGAGPTYFAAGSGRPGFGPPGGGGGFGGGTADVDAALRYVESHGAATRFPLIVSSEQEAAPYVIAGKPVSSMGGFTGRETVLTTAYLAALLEKGEARYFLLGGQGGIGPGGAANAAATTIESACTAVPSSAWGGSGSAATLYDCAGANP
jgi:4-amino-4-deoxy-L-arabinose transferase-like glycosyltransferase